MSDWRTNKKTKKKFRFAPSDTPITKEIRESLGEPTLGVHSSPTHEYFEGPLGEISVPKKTRRCKGCGAEFAFTVEEVFRHKKHGDVVRIEDDDRYRLK
jgi:hypothetical protein